MFTLLAYLRVACRTADDKGLTSRLGGEIVLKSLRSVFIRTTKTVDSGDDEDVDELICKPEEKESLWNTLTAGLASIYPFKDEPEMEETLIP